MTLAAPPSIVLAQLEEGGGNIADLPGMIANLGDQGPFALMLAIALIAIGVLSGLVLRAYNRAVARERESAAREKEHAAQIDAIRVAHTEARERDLREILSNSNSLAATIGTFKTAFDAAMVRLDAVMARVEQLFVAKRPGGRT